MLMQEEPDLGSARLRAKRAAESGSTGSGVVMVDATTIFPGA